VATRGRPRTLASPFCGVILVSLSQAYFLPPVTLSRLRLPKLTANCYRCYGGKKQVSSLLFLFSAVVQRAQLFCEGKRERERDRDRGLQRRISVFFRRLREHFVAVLLEIEVLLERGVKLGSHGSSGSKCRGPLHIQFGSSSTDPTSLLNLSCLPVQVECSSSKSTAEFVRFHEHFLFFSFLFVASPNIIALKTRIRNVEQAFWICTGREIWSRL
jgi:hypothetical protein